jgi:hypothetical protein
MGICHNSNAQDIPSCPIIMNYIQNDLPHYGILKNSSEFVYVEIDEKYIHKLVAFIQKDGFEEPPYFGSSNVGAHITVIYPNEIQKYGTREIQECGEKIFFTPKECQIVHPPRWEGMDEVYLIVVEAPELDKIREKYGLPKREYDFHITIGVKPKMAKSA